MGGTGYDDTLIGDPKSNFLSGGGGKDRLYGRLGSDILMGDSGSGDELYGNRGWDHLISTRDGHQSGDVPVLLDGGKDRDICERGVRADIKINCEYSVPR